MGHFENGRYVMIDRKINKDYGPFDRVEFEKTTKEQVLPYCIYMPDYGFNGSDFLIDANDYNLLYPNNTLSNTGNYLI